MSSPDPDALRTVAFGGLDRGVWGVVWAIGSPDRALAVFGSGDQIVQSELTLRPPDPDKPWMLAGEGIQLAGTSVGPGVSADSPLDQGPTLQGELCRVEGTLSVAGIEHRVDSLGCRLWFSEGPDLSGLDSVRILCGWFEPADAIFLVSLRPRKARGQESDVVAAAVVEEQAATVVAEPRLSTTYRDNGRPSRASLELWLTSEDEEETTFPRRAAGEALGLGVKVQAGPVALRAEPYRWRFRDHTGAGIYLLAQSR